MNDKTKDSVFAAFLMLMRPAARLLLRCGVSWKEAAELTKMAFVEAAADEFGKHGRPANSSRIALVTGLGRREVKRLRDLIESPAPLDTDSALNTVNQASRLLSGWHQDPDFSTAPGKPKLLAPRGKGSFEALAKRYAPDIPPTVILKELKDVGAIRETAAGRLRALARYYMPSESALESMVRSGSVLADFSTTVVHNLFSGDKPTRFEGRATSLRVKRRAERAFQQYLEREAMAFLEDADAWLTAHEVAADDEEPGTRLGVGVYMIRDEK